ncbi:MAG: hypothetical protein NC548_02835, partial [Lachnospiraceae bacterium]|nr:hypothetical protein [Lachnospiraceae bacterium]
FDVKKYERSLRAEGFEEGVEKGIEEGIEKGFKDGVERGFEDGMKKGIQQGQKQEAERINKLNLILSEQNRTDDIIRAAQDSEYQEQLFREFGLL